MGISLSDFGFGVIFEGMFLFVFVVFLMIVFVFFLVMLLVVYVEDV